MDRTGWPFAIGLFPVGKYQSERFLAAQGKRYQDAWYRELLAVNPRCGWRDWGEKPWELFITGLNDAARDDFFRFLGVGYRLPTADEWRALLEASDEVREIRDELLEAIPDASPQVLHWLREGLYPLARAGLLEQVTDGGRVRCMGRPWWPKPAFFSNTWTPGDARDVNWMQARRLVGFRVVRV